jgi:hypothetical protein
MLAEVFHRRLAVHAGAAGAAKDQRDAVPVPAEAGFGHQPPRAKARGQGLPGSSMTVPGFVSRRHTGAGGHWLWLWLMT